MSNTEVVIRSSDGPYCGSYEYVDENIHEALKKYDKLDGLMRILCADLAGYRYKLDFSIVNGLFKNNLVITNDRLERKSDSGDTIRDEVEEDFDRRDRRFTI